MRKTTRYGWGLILVLLSSLAPAAKAVEVHFEKVVEGVYAHIGDTGARSVGNEGLNANIGLVLTPSGAVLIDSGATYASARKIHEAAQRITKHPIRWVINTGGQDHRWLGNGYFAEQGAQILAHANAKADMQNRGADHVAALQQVLGSKAEGTKPTLARIWISKDDDSLMLDGVRFEFRHRGGAHTPGDMLVYLPAQKTMFSGDVVYVDRMLGVIPVSNTKNWLTTFAQIEALAPARIIPGHGALTSLKKAQEQTKNYLLSVRQHMKKAVDDGVDISAAVRSFPADPYMHLLNAKDLLPGNSSRTYLELERE